VCCGPPLEQGLQNKTSLEMIKLPNKDRFAFSSFELIQPVFSKLIEQAIKHTQLTMRATLHHIKARIKFHVIGRSFSTTL
jgi:hypothetical protein